ncbi:MAG: hypothetical protein RI897_2395 [Verrucomicrobiota bacterium]|jgi:hypothetical protein
MWGDAERGRGELRAVGSLAGFLGVAFPFLEFLLPSFAGLLASEIEFTGCLALFEPFVYQVGDEEGCYDAYDDQGSQRFAGQRRFVSHDVWTYG